MEVFGWGKQRRSLCRKRWSYCGGGGEENNEEAEIIDKVMLEIEEVKNTIIQGDCLEVLKTFEDNSIKLIITSPPL